MRACASCFAVQTWVVNADASYGGPGTCSFGHDYSPDTWLLDAWAENIQNLFSLYELSEGESAENSFVEQLQEDWGIFALTDNEEILRFLTHVLNDHPFLAKHANVSLRVQDSSSDDLASWSLFSEEIRGRNRYFVSNLPNTKILADAFRSCVKTISPAVALYRARVSEDGKPIAPRHLGAPPANKAAGGRANPAGIPYLYLSFALETTIYESRSTNQSFVSVGTFRTTMPLKVLDLADIEPPDFFSDDQASRVSLHRYLKKLGGELSRPISEQDTLTDYIPTQYLCEFAKSLGLDGVLYSSSLHSKGRNLVLFDPSAATCNDHVQHFRITGVHPQWEQHDCAPKV